MSLPVEELRAKFPALQQPQVFLDNAGGSQALGSVITAIQEYLSKTNVQLGASYTSSKQATDLYNKGYAAAAQYINAPENSIVLGPSTTQLFRNLSYALSFPAGSEIIISQLDHEANIASWVSLAARQSLVIKWWTPDPSSLDPKSGTINPLLTPSNLTPLLSPKTVLVSCTHASNILGSIHDIAALSATIKSAAPEALFIVDAVAYAPHRPIDVQALGVDVYAFSWYKVYGPHIAQLYTSPRALASVSSLGHYFNPSESLAEKLGLAGGSYELIAGIPSVVGYFSESGGSEFWRRVREHEEGLQRILLEYLTSVPSVTILGNPTSDPKARVPTISFVVRGRSSRDVVEAVDAATGEGAGNGNKQFGIRWGHFYSKRLCDDVLALGKESEGVVRVSAVHYNTVQEIRALVEVLRRVLG